MDTIVLIFNPFIMKSSLHIVKNGEIKYKQVASDIDEAVDTIIGLAYEHQIYKVKIEASRPIFSVICEQINKQERLEYSANKIEVEEIVR